MVLQLSRDEFFNDYFDYRPGEHCSWIYPTRRGKTQLAYQCAQVAMRQNPGLRFVSMMPKPRDEATVRWMAQLGLKETPSWPPQRWPWQEKPAGWVLWPRHDKQASTLDNAARIGGEMRRGLDAQYWDGNSITLADDVHVLAVLLGLNPECERHWTSGGSNNAGLWAPNQKPSGTQGSGSVSSFSYNSPVHLFLGRDTDERNIKRFGEIGGIEPREVESVVRGLRLYRIGENTISEVLYIDKRGPYMALIGP